MVVARAFALAFLAASLGCNGKGDTAPSQDAYADPIASAGPDLAAVRGDSITLDGSASAASAGESLAYSWAFEQVPLESSLDDTKFGTANGTANAITTTVTPDVVGTYVISLVVSDSVTSSGRDLAVITVTSNNLAPVADAGPDSTGQVGTATALDGTGSFDPDPGGSITIYEWDIASAPSDDEGQLYDRYSATPSLLPDAPGVWVLGLRVSDGLAWSESDFVAINVDTDNLAPVADAGVSRTQSPCAGSEVELDGAGSYDPEGVSLTYEWAVTEVPDSSEATDADFDDPTAASPVFSTDLPGSYAFTLQVSDGEVTSAKDVVTVTVSSLLDNNAPIADAGDAIDVDENVDCRNESGQLTCDTCNDLEFELDGAGSIDPDGDTLAYKWTVDGASVQLPTSPWTTAVGDPIEGSTGGGTTVILDATLEVADCIYTSTDTIQVTLTCVGEP